MKKLGFVLLNLSAAWLCCASAGGAYCAKTARARAAALGLHLPGVHHRGTDLSELPPYSALRPQASPPPLHHHHHHHQHYRLFQNNPQPPASGYNTLYNLPKDIPRFQPAGYDAAAVRANPLLSRLSGGDPLNDRQSNFAQVKRVAGPISRTQPPGRANFVDRSSESQRSGLQFAYNGRYVGVVDPNRRGVSGFYMMSSPVGAGSEPDVVYPVGEKGNRLSGGHSPWHMYARANDKPRYPFYKLEKR